MPTYTVALKGAERLPSPERIEAEIRFARAIERLLGEPSEVADAYQAWSRASETEIADLDATTATKAVRWRRAYEAAALAGLTGVFGLEGAARFEVRLQWPS